MKIGLSLGIIVFVFLSLLGVVLALKKRRKARRGEHDSTEPTELPKQLDSTEVFAIQEIAINSLIDIYRELPDSGKAELLDASTSTGSGHEISELSQPSLPIVHELMTHCSSDESLMAQSLRPKDESAILVSTNMSRESWANTSPPAGVASIETIISTQKTKEVDLDRSLPPTPISESLQVSPVVASFHECFMTGEGITSVLEEASVARSLLGTIGQVSSDTLFAEGENDSVSRENPPCYHPLRGLEVVVPPGHSEADIHTPSNIYTKDGKRRCKVF